VLIKRLFVVLAIIISWAEISLADCSTDINNKDVCPPPQPAPTLPPRGEKFIDPTFGTEIVRVTDRTDGNRAGVAYSYWSPFNADSTRFFIHIDGVAFLYDLDKMADRVKKIGKLFPPGGRKFHAEGIIWSGKDPDILYGVAWDSVYQYNVVTRTYKELFSSPDVWPGTYLWQMSMSEDDDVFAFTIRQSSDYGELGAGYYKRSTDTWRRYDCAINECQVDKSGAYVSIMHGDGRDPHWTIWHVSDDRKETIGWNGSERGPGHYDQGFGRLLGASAWGDFNLRDLDNPDEWTPIFPGSCCWHVSWRNNDDQVVYLSNYFDGPVTEPFKNEIVQLFLDGSGRYRRLAHHRSVIHSYSDISFASSDRLGKHIIYQSNWDDSGFRDVFILKIPEQFQVPKRSMGDLNNDQRVDVQDVQACVNVILGTETSPAVCQRAQQVAAPQDVCDVLDVQELVNTILD
jgi:hypothetical protein